VRSHWGLSRLMALRGLSVTATVLSEGGAMVTESKQGVVPFTPFDEAGGTVTWVVPAVALQN